MAQAADEKKPQDLTKVLTDAALWSMPMDTLQKQCVVVPTAEQKRMAEIRKQLLKKRGIEVAENSFGGFEWLSVSKDGLRAEAEEFQLFGETLGEVVIKGVDGKVGPISISLFNRGDDEEIKAAELQTRFDTWLQRMDEKLGVKGEVRKSQSAVKLRSHMWRKGDSAWLLESSIGKDERGYDRAEFLRLRIASISGASSGKIAGRSTLGGNVETKDNGDHYIKNMPMVDQGQKGYCAVASIARVAAYYGLDADQHEIAQLANTSKMGTSPEEMEEAFKVIIGKLHIRSTQHYEFSQRQFEADVRAYNKEAKKASKPVFEAPKGYILLPEGVWSRMDPDIFAQIKGRQSGCKRMMTKIREYIDQGIPLCWCLRLGMFPEPGLPQADGGHMRLIIGYNEKTQEIIYSDSWGKGHEFKKMTIDKAYACSMCLYTMSPTR